MEAGGIGDKGVFASVGAGVVCSEPRAAARLMR
jgi:hypothetical protein